MLGAFLTALPVVAVIAPATWRCFADPSIAPSTNFKCSVVDVPLRRRGKMQSLQHSSFAKTDCAKENGAPQFRTPTPNRFQNP
jgi:hypothetical protein